MKMSTLTRMGLLKQRAALLEARGPHNSNLIRKIKRQLRKLEKEN